MKKFLSRFLYSVPIFLFLTAGAASALDFKTDVQPIFREKCFKCHSGPKAKSKLRYDKEEYFAKRIGEGEEAVVIPGKPEESKLIKLASLGRADTDAMPPPRRGEGLTVTELSVIKKWIAEGASLESGGAETTPEPAPTEAPKLYTWTNTKGVTLQAYFVRLEGRSVVLKKEDGTEFTYAVTMLNSESRQQASKLAAEQ